MFRCKQFSIDDTGATMKVGNDAIMLGALATPNDEPHTILDIGTGCGILALMMAQRFPLASVTAIDIDNTTVDVAKNNFASSPFCSRLTTEHCDLHEFSTQCEGMLFFDFIISNPPYFSNSLRNEDPRRRLARHDDSLTLGQLFADSVKILSANGVISIIIPTSESFRAINEAFKSNLRCCRQTDICNHPGDPSKRTILHFTNATNSTSEISDSPIHTTISLRNPDNNYSSDYITLTSPFLL